MKQSNGGVFPFIWYAEN